jgi:hypothetical protein
MANKIISQADLREFFDYKNGELFWIQCKGTAKSGQKSGNLSQDGYLNSRFYGTSYRTHRLIYLWHYGYIPKELDHIDGNKLNNKIENLRPANRMQNSHNTKIPNTNKSGTKGVSWIKRLQKWVVQLQVNNKKMYFGLYNDVDYAIFVANTMRYKYHKEFARTK